MGAKQASKRRPFLLSLRLSQPDPHTHHLKVVVLFRYELQLTSPHKNADGKLTEHQFTLISFAGRQGRTIQAVYDGAFLNRNKSKLFGCRMVDMADTKLLVSTEIVYASQFDQRHGIVVHRAYKPRNGDFSFLHCQLTYQN